MRENIIKNICIWKDTAERLASMQREILFDISDKTSWDK